MRLFGCERVSGALSSPGEGILVVASVFNDFLYTVDELSGRIEVGKAL